MNLAQALKTYLGIFPHDREKLADLLEQIKADEALNNRRNFRGHITGSGIVLSPDKRQILLVHHKLLNAWLQPGGHWEESEPDPLEAAVRETVEETGVELAETLSLISDQPLVPLDIGSHEIPAQPAKDEPPHRHYDFRYAFVAKDLLFEQADAALDGIAWYDLDDPMTERISGALDRLRQRKLI